MDEDAAVFSNIDECRLWKHLVLLENVSSRRIDSSYPKLVKVVNDIIESESFVNSAILCKVMDLMVLYKYKDLCNIILKVLDRCKAYDSKPRLKASRILRENNSAELSATVLDSMTVDNDPASWEYERGLTALDMGFLNDAKMHFIASLKYNSDKMEVYERLQSLDRNGKWEYRGWIQRILAGESTPQLDCIATDRIEDLYSIYLNWGSGNRLLAFDMLKRSTPYGECNDDYMLAAARFLVGFNDNVGAVEHFKKIKDPTFSVRLEMARACLASGSFKDALSICSDLEKICDTEQRLMETKISVYASMDDLESLSDYADMYLYNDYAGVKGYAFVAELMISKSMFAQASHIIDRMMMSDDDSYLVPYLTAKNEFYSGRPKKALAHISKAVRRSSGAPECRILRSEIYLSLGKIRKALNDVDKILTADDRNIDALSLKKKIVRETGDLEFAYQICQTIREMNPSDVDNIQDIASILEDTGKSDEAISLYREAIELKIDPLLFMTVITSLMEKKRYEEAINIIDQYDDIYSTSDVFAIKGNAEYAIGRYSDACSSYERSLDLDPNNPMVWHSKGMASEAIEDYESAETAYDRAVLLDLDNTEYWISKAAVHEKGGSYATAVDALNHVIDLHPDNVYSLMMKSSILFKIGRKNDALSFVNIAMEICPDDISIMRAKRDICISIGDIDEAKAMCKAILSLEPDDEECKTIYFDLTNNEKEEVEEETVSVPDESDVKAYAEKLLMCSDGKDEDLDSPSLMTEADIPVDMRDRVLSYMSDIKDYGIIVPNDDDFNRMEDLSYNAVINGGIKDIGKTHLLPLQTAFLRSGAYDVDEAKRLIAYVYKALEMDLVPAEFNLRVNEILSETKDTEGDLDIYDVMRRYSIGVFTARTVMMLSFRDDSVVGHI